jgi:hypothetical protein
MRHTRALDIPETPNMDGIVEGIRRITIMWRYMGASPGSNVR